MSFIYQPLCCRKSEPSCMWNPLLTPSPAVITSTFDLGGEKGNIFFIGKS
jgi:hypothetical protein